VGNWYHFGNFDDYRYGTDGLPLASPESNGQPLVYHGDFGVHGVFDQLIWHRPGDDPSKGIGLFGRIAMSPPEQNLIDFYAELGINCMGLWPQRPDDSFGLAAGYLRASPQLSGYEQDQNFYEGTANPVQNFEAGFELTYQAQIIPGWTIQPDFQYIFHPGLVEANPENTYSGRIKDSAVFGLRTSLKF
jgi:porin